LLTTPFYKTKHQWLGSEQVAGSSEPVETLSLEHFTFVHSVNVLGPLRMLQAFLPMLRQAKGRVINISRSANGRSIE